jgi:hypothetical protein
VDNVSDLTLALASAVSGQLVWVPPVTITVPNAAYGKTVKSGVALATQGGKIKWDYYGPTTGYMIPLLNLSSEGILSGLVFEGGGGYGRYGYDAGPCAIRASGARHTLIENCDVSKFRGAGIWFGDGSASISVWNDDNQRNILRHCDVRNAQQYGFGYGIGEQGGSQSWLAEACRFGNNRHSTMLAGGTTSYEVRYSSFEDAIYANSDTGPATVQSHQVDAHGGGFYGFKAGVHIYIHRNTLSRNNSFSEKPNIMIRGVVSSECIVEYCWTKKTYRSGVHDETVSNQLVQLAAEEGGTWDGPSNLLSTANVVCRQNWYGTNPPPDVGGLRKMAVTVAVARR